MGKRLYVGNLSFDTMEGDVMDLFSKVGKVVSCNLVTDRYTGKSRGFAFVEMSTQEEADKAVAEVNGKDLDGRSLRINEARPREERDSRPPRRDFGGGRDDRG